MQASIENVFGVARYCVVKGRQKEERTSLTSNHYQASNLDRVYFFFRDVK